MSSSTLWRHLTQVVLAALLAVLILPAATAQAQSDDGFEFDRDDRGGRWGIDDRPDTQPEPDPDDEPAPDDTEDEPEPADASDSGSSDSDSSDSGSDVEASGAADDDEPGGESASGVAQGSDGVGWLPLLGVAALLALGSLAFFAARRNRKESEKERLAMPKTSVPKGAGPAATSGGKVDWNVKVSDPIPAAPVAAPAAATAAAAAIVLPEIDTPDVTTSEAAPQIELPQTELPATAVADQIVLPDAPTGIVFDDSTVPSPSSRLTERMAAAGEARAAAADQQPPETPQVVLPDTSIDRLIAEAPEALPPDPSIGASIETDSTAIEETPQVVLPDSPADTALAAPPAALPDPSVGPPPTMATPQLVLPAPDSVEEPTAEQAEATSPTPEPETGSPTPASPETGSPEPAARDAESELETVVTAESDQITEASETVDGLPTRPTGELPVRARGETLEAAGDGELNFED